LGITASVSTDWLLILAVSVTLVAVVLYAFQQITKVFSSKPYFISSFSEGNLMSTLHVVARAEVDELDSSVLLSSKTLESDEISYTLASPNFEVLKAIEVSLRGNSSVISIQLGK
jgi:hypothetical protein